MDRRAFLASYDPTRDDLERTILTRILRAAVPVCGGINLQYYFSFVDSPGWGCGTKLPHNVTGLLGVMDGAASDLRTGLPWQGVEIHEPLRLLFIIESTPAIMTRILRDNPEIRQPIANGWVQLSVIDPSSDAVFLYDAGEFLPYHPENTLLPRMASSAEWYRGWRDHLPFAVLQNQR